MEEWGKIEEWNTSENDKGSDFELLQKAVLVKKKNDDLHTARAKALSELCFLPAEGEQWRIITHKQFNAYALILLLLETREIEEMYLAIYRINEPTVTSIMDLIDSGRIKKASFIISSFFNQTKKPEKWAKDLCDYCAAHSQCNFIYLHNHAKVLAVRTTKDEYFVFEGSGNMSDNARIEQYVYEQNKKVFNFHKAWMLDLINKG